MVTLAAVIAQQIGLYGHTGPVQPGWLPAVDKVQHALGFALPMFLLLTTLDLYAARAGRTLRPWWIATVGAVFALNAVASELVQGRSGSGRTGDPVDAAADLVGIALGWSCYRAVRNRTRIRQGSANNDVVHRDGARPGVRDRFGVQDGR